MARETIPERPWRNGETAGEDRRFAALAALVFALLTLPRLLLHELWRDEAWYWLEATGSRTLGQLFEPLRRTGEGYLFPVLCYLARQVSTSPRAMQLLHLALAGAAAFVLARWAPLGRRESALFLLGYFPFYEYAVISRHYAAGVLLAWLACAAARGRRPALALGAALGLLVQTTVYGYILAIAIAAGWLLDHWQRRRDLAPLPLGDVVAGAAMALAGAMAGLLQLIPLPDTISARGWHFGWDPAQAARVLAVPWRAFVPLPRPELHFWNTNLLDAWPGVEAAAGIGALALGAALLWKSRVALATFLLGAAGLLAFSYIKFLGSVRHHGHLWLLLAAALWLGGGRGFEDRRSWRARALLVLLIVQLGAAAYASWMDIRHPFSNGAATADLLRREGLDRATLLGYREPPAATVALYLGRPLYFPSRRVFTTYPDYGPEQRELTNEELRCAARDLARRQGGDVVLVINRELPPWREIDPAGAAVGAIVATEDYHLYRLRLDRLAATAREAACPGEVTRTET